jgi:hypothetical protein
MTTMSDYLHKLAAWHQDQPKAFIMHHTGGGGTPAGVQAVERQHTFNASFESG